MSTNVVSKRLSRLTGMKEVRYSEYSDAHVCWRIRNHGRRKKKIVLGSPGFVDDSRDMATLFELPYLRHASYFPSSCYPLDIA